MTYFYQRITPTISRPIIRIIVKSHDQYAIYYTLIDSGADYCIFDIELAKVLEVKLTKKYTKIRGVGKDEVKGYWGEVEIILNEYHYKAKVIFAEISNFDHGILGQQGFFDHFDVKLSYQKQVIDIEPI